MPQEKVKGSQLNVVDVANEIANDSTAIGQGPTALARMGFN